MPPTDIAIHPEQVIRPGSLAGIPIREDTLYTNHKGQEKTGLRKRVDKALLGKLQSALAKVLEPEEVVLYVAQGQAPASVFEQLAFGWYTYSITRTLLVLTNRRLLTFLVKRDGTWKESLSAVRWGDVEQAKVGGMLSPTLQLKYRDGKKETYWALRRGDAKKIKVLVAAILPHSTGEGSAAQGRVQLCPDCFTALTPGVYQCGHCGLTFKDEQTLIRRSLLYPGGGYFYGGYWFLGIGDFIVEALLASWLIIFCLVGLGWAQEDLQPLEPAAGVEGALGAAGVFALLLAVEKLFTIHHGRRFVREYIPLRGSAASSRWRAFAVISYVLIGLVVWSSVVPVQEPLAEVAPDLAVTQAHFGLFALDRAGTLHFTPTSVVPRTEGQQYGWVLRLRTSRPTVYWREEIVLPFAAGGTSAGEMVSPTADPPVAINESQGTPEGGLLASSWAVGEEDPPGIYTLRVFLEKTLVQTFTFEMR